MKKAHIAGIAAVALTVLSAAAAPQSAAQEIQQVRADGLSTTVTLITGDQVTVNGGEVKATPGKGREGVGIQTYTDVRGDLHAVPTDAAAQIGSGALDARLFNVSLLARSGYDDRSRDTTPLIVQGARIRAEKAKKNGEFWTAARAQGTTKVWLDGKIKASLDRSAPQIGAPEAWQKGLTGAGVTVAVLDTGIDTTHPDLVGSVVEERNFTDTESTDDRQGHGTHVAATITGAGKYQGIAPDAKLINGKVLDDTGNGHESDLIEAMEWAAPKAKIVNLSLGDDTPSAGDDIMSVALNRISAQTGTLFVVAAGNNRVSINSPAAADAALTVGAVDRDDKLAPFSSRGPRIKDGAIKPDITAPGVGIVAAKAKNGFIGTPVGDAHVALNGTSMATPHVAGAAAILAAQHPQWRAPELKAALMNTAKPDGVSTVFEQGTGRVDVAKAVDAAVTALPGSVSFGAPEFPHGDDEPVTRTVTYRNTGTAPVTLDLKIDGTGPFTVTPASLTVPAGGTADAAVTSDTRADILDQQYVATLLASNGLRVPLTVDKQSQRHEVTLKFVGVDGNPIDQYDYRFVDLERPLEYKMFDEGGYDPSGTVTRRLPQGTYLLTAQTSDRDAVTGRITTRLTEPKLVVTGPTEIVVDPRLGDSPDIAVQGEGAADAAVEVGYTAKTKWGTYKERSQLYQGFPNYRILPSRTTNPDFEWYAQSVKGKKNSAGTFEGSPWIYHVRISEKGMQPANVRRTVSDRDLAQVDSVTHARVPGSTGIRDRAASGPLPLRLKEFYTPDMGWSAELWENGPSGEQLTSQVVTTPRTYPRGQKITEHFNTAVFGPAMPYGAVASLFGPDSTVRNAWRTGDHIELAIPMFSAARDMHTRSSDRRPQRTVISRNGEVLSDWAVAGSGQAEVPAAKDTYQVRAEAVQDVTEWTFTSQRTEDKQAIPLLAVRFEPALDDHNRAKAGVPLTFPVFVQRNNAEKPVTDVKTPEIQVSYDEGGTWQPVKVFRVGKNWYVTLAHPKNAKSVSLKAKTSDTAGSVDQTHIRAYELK